ncbi:MAG: ABC transporter permease [Gaiellales bacterium]
MRTLLIARNELVRRLRNRSALVTAFLGPLTMATVFSLLVSGAGSGGFRIGVVDQDGGAVAAELAAGLRSSSGNGGGQVQIVRIDRVATARHRTDTGSIDAAVVIPAGFAAAAARGRPEPTIVLRSPERLIGGQVAQALALGISDTVRRITLSVRTAAAAARRPPNAGLVAAARRQPSPFETGSLTMGGREVSTAAFYGASMSILFLFFTVAFASRSLLSDRRDGTLSRMLATPTAPGTILAGKTVAVAVLGMAGLVTMWAVTSLGFGARWGDPAGVLAVMAATVLAVGGVSMLVASLARSDQQADAYTSIVTFSFALLGGNFVGPGQAPALLQRLQLLTPNGWALRAFTDLSADAAGLRSVLATLTVLLAIAAVTGGVGITRSYRLIRP